MRTCSLFKAFLKYLKFLWFSLHLSLSTILKCLRLSLSTILKCLRLIDAWVQFFGAFTRVQAQKFLLTSTFMTHKRLSTILVCFYNLLTFKCHTWWGTKLRNIISKTLQRWYLNQHWSPIRHLGKQLKDVSFPKTATTFYASSTASVASWVQEPSFHAVNESIKPCCTQRTKLS